MLQTRYILECSDDESGDDENCGSPQTVLSPTVRLSSGQYMPVLGFGTYGLGGTECKMVINWAIESGFRHFDTAYGYNNEREIGEAIHEQIENGNITREDIFIVDKLWSTHHEPKHVRRICEQQLENLGVDYIDLYLMHFPVGFKFVCDEMLLPKEKDELQLSDVDYVDTYLAMEELVRDGLVRSIGVSNFNIEQVQRIIANTTMKPVVNQVEVWPGFMQKELIDYCRYNGIVVTAYAPLGQPDREKHTPIYFFSVRMKQICRHYKKKPAQIVLRYLIDSGVVPIPKSSNPFHIEENIEIFDFKLSEQHMAAIRNIKPKKRLVQYNEVKALKHQYYPFSESEDEEKEEEATTTQPEDEAEEEEESFEEPPLPPPPPAEPQP